MGKRLQEEQEWGLKTWSRTTGGSDGHLGRPGRHLKNYYSCTSWMLSKVK